MSNKYDNGGWLEVGLTSHSPSVAPSYHTGGFIAPWSKQKYAIKEVSYTHHPYKDLTEFMISYHDNQTGQDMGVAVHVSGQSMYGASTEQIMDLVADMAADHVKDLEFYDALMKYFNKGKLFSKQMHQQHIHVPALPPVDQEALKAAMYEPLYKPASVGPNMQDVNDLPGVMESVKHPVGGDLYRIKDIIINLNDQHMWTREQIADWLETLDVDLRFKDPEVRLRDKQRKTLEAKLSLATAALEQHQKSVKEQRKIVNKLKKELEALNEQD